MRALAVQCDSPSYLTHHAMNTGPIRASRAFGGRFAAVFKRAARGVMVLSALTLSLALGSTGAFAAGQPRVLLKTSQGDITLELDPQKAPKTVANFMAYVKSGHYSGTVFHRVIPGFMIQGGGFTAGMVQKPTQPPIALESRNGLSNMTGTVAMARTSDPNSATSQFFINTADNKNLDYPQPDGNGYAVFGKVVAGMDVVRKIEATPTGDNGMYQNVPQTPVVIQSATIVSP